MITPIDPAFYKELLDLMSDGVYFVDCDRRIVYWNEGARRLTGYSAEEMVGKHCQDDLLCHVDPAGHNLCRDGCPLAASLEDAQARSASVFLRHKEGRRVPVSIRVQPIRGADGTIIGAIEVFSDDSANWDTRRKVEAMERLALLDHLTQLPNRRCMEMSLHTALSEYQEHKEAFGVMMFDVDRLKKINDTFGHNSGDSALRQVAFTLMGSLRPEDLIGRWGGDEFLAIVRNINRENLEKLMTRCAVIVSTTSTTNQDGRRISLSVSAGASLAHRGVTAEEIVQRADEQMYRNKAGLRAGLRIL